MILAGALRATPTADLVARIHFVGAQKIAADPESRAFTNVFCRASAQALQAQTLDKLSMRPTPG